MYQLLLSVSLLACVITSCHPSESGDQKERLIKDSASKVTGKMPKDCEFYHREAVKNDSILLKSTSMNASEAERALKAFNTFASICKDDVLAPVFLLKGAQVAQSIGKFTQAQAMLNACIHEFPNFKNRGAALFLLAQLYDDAGMLNDETQASTLYNQILREYPKTDWSRDAQSALNNIGKSDEELIEEFLKKTK